MDQELLDKLMLSYKLGEEEAFKDLYCRVSPVLNGYLHKRLNSTQDIEEVFQLVFAKLHNSRAQYNSAYPFMPWFFTIIQSVLNDYLRAKMRSAEKESEFIQAMKTNSTLEEIPYRDSQSLKALLEQFERVLPKNQSDAVKMRFLEDKSFAEIAENMNTSEANARKLISRAVKKLKLADFRK